MCDGTFMVWNVLASRTERFEYEVTRRCTDLQGVRLGPLCPAPQLMSSLLCMPPPIELTVLCTAPYGVMHPPKCLQKLPC